VAKTPPGLRAHQPATKDMSGRLAGIVW
jgi:hypothetical protein